MESTGRCSNGLGSLNPKCHYEYQEMRGVASHLIHSLDPPLLGLSLGLEGVRFRVRVRSSRVRVRRVRVRSGKKVYG